MTIRKQIYTAGAIAFVVLVVLASMNIAMHLKVVHNLKVLDRVNHRLAVAEEYARWSNNLNLLVSDVVAAGRVPQFSDKALEPPAEVQAEESSTLVEHARTLIDLVREKETKTRDAERRFDALRVSINDLYYTLDQKIATVLAVVQMDQVLGKGEKSEESALAPYVLKSLNQLTLVALDNLLSRDYSPTDMDIVDQNRRFLSSQLSIIDTDGSMAKLFDKLFAEIDSLARLIPQVDRELHHLETRIATAKENVDEALAGSNISTVLTAAAAEVRTANESLENVSRRTLIVCVLFLVAVPLSVVAAGLFGLNRRVVRPITELVGAMKDVVQGSFDVVAPVRRQDEIGRLAEAFNAMARQIKGKVDDLAMLNQTLEESEEQLKTILESSANPIAVYDANGWPQYLSPAFTETFGWRLESVAGCRIPYVPEDQQDLTTSSMNEVFATGRPVKYPTTRLTQEGKELDVIISVALIRGAKGEPRGIVENLTDVSEQKLLETQLRQSQKMEAVGQLAGGVAHDFNNILTAIFGNVEMAIDEVEAEFPNASELLVDLQQIDQGARRASSLTRQLLAFSRRQVIHPEVLDVNTTLCDLEKMLRRLITEDIELELCCAPQLQRVKADPGQLEQVIVNLVVNARDAMKDGGRLTIETNNVVLDESYAATHPEVTAGPHVALAVSDTGCGMNPSTLERVFEPFFTTKPTGQGTGLGLSTVYGILKQAGGSVSVYSEPGQGTTFKIYLPAVEEAAALHERHVSEGPPPGGSETILICEDDGAVRDLTARMLTDAGYTVLEAEKPADALRMADETPGRIELLIADVIMPDMNGRKLSDALLARRPDVRTLFVSGYTANVIAHHGVLNEDVEFLEKPYSRRQLLDRVREVLDRTPCESTTP